MSEKEILTEMVILQSGCEIRTSKNTLPAHGNQTMQASGAKQEYKDYSSSITKVSGCHTGQYSHDAFL